MNELYEKQQDGTLKPLEYPQELAEKSYVYLWLRDKGLTVDEIKFLWDSSTPY